MFTAAAAAVISRAWTFSSNMANSYSQLVCGTSAPMDFALPNIGSVLPPLILAGRGYSLKGNKYVSCLIFQGSVLKLTNPSSLTF